MKATSLMLRKHLINLIEAMTKREIFENLQRTEHEHKMKQRNNPSETARVPW
jgi:hypothetical protein